DRRDLHDLKRTKRTVGITQSGRLSYPSGTPSTLLVTNPTGLQARRERVLPEERGLPPAPTMRPSGRRPDRRRPCRRTTRDSRRSAPAPVRSPLPRAPARQTPALRGTSFPTG